MKKVKYIDLRSRTETIPRETMVIVMERSNLTPPYTVCTNSEVQPEGRTLTKNVRSAS